MDSEILDWRRELQRLEEILNRVGPDEVCCEGLSARQCFILRTLATGEGATLSILADSVGITPSAMTRVVERLENLGLVDRVHGRLQDGRATAVAITNLGQKTLHRIDELMLERTREIVAGVPVPERATLLRCLRLLNKAMERPGCCMADTQRRRKHSQSKISSWSMITG